MHLYGFIGLIKNHIKFKQKKKVFHIIIDYSSYDKLSFSLFCFVFVYHLNTSLCRAFVHFATLEYKLGKSIHTCVSGTIRACLCCKW